MAAKLLTASGAIATSGANNRVTKMILSSDGAAGTAVFKTGGAAGTNTSITFEVANGSSYELELGAYNIIADYLTLTNAQAMVLSFGE